MEKYKNLKGDSGVQSYEIGSDFIIVHFKNDGSYLYNYDIPGSSHVERMKKLATKGKGLSTYISTIVKKKFAEKIN
ncbi:hypothetical protein SD960_21465 [Flavobacterium sp. MMLR14_040]|uniref:hypothetical protein n=1 Tax=Flavobacterium sp. MMLR14_040 TaxID=3093843 RepID=UPI00298FDBF3|nr:hypothetical protein [Flavobacterium sp. MMLR14_040]MDW8852685.1 hypothetical protein [Flavobacterium sp. MMLR14_040]